MARPRILVVDDDESTRRYLSSLLVGCGYPVDCAESGLSALGRLGGRDGPGAVLLDLLMPELDGLATLDRIRERNPRLPVIVLSTVQQLKTVVEAMRRGATDYLTKPFDEGDLEIALENALGGAERSREQGPRSARGAPPGASDFVAASPAMQRIRSIALQVAGTDAPVLLLGESGVGKEVVGRFIHEQSGRARKALVKVNCAALPHDLLESELFGYERGAFSGAVGEKPGKFELADRGTILLDEIGEMSPSLQAKILHVLQDGEFTRLGGRQSIRSEARVLASTNRRLEEVIASGRFREDLYFRLNVIRLEIPALRERREDLPLLAEHFLRRYRARYESDVTALPEALVEAFQRYEWPGNVRELENVIRRYVILPDLELTLWDLRSGRRAATASEAPGSPGEASSGSAPDGPPPAEAPQAEGLSLKRVAARAAEDAERALVSRVLAETRWNRREAARRLNISYKALLNKLKRWEGGDGRGPRTAL